MNAQSVAAAIQSLPGDTTGERYPYGPICLRDETKGYTLPLADYLTRVRQVESAIADRRRVAQGIRRLYYAPMMSGSYGGRVANFDRAIEPVDDLPTTLTIADGIPREALTDLARCGGVRVPGGVVDVSHLWCALDMAANKPVTKLRLGSALSIPEPRALATWAGDLGSILVQWCARKRDAAPTAEPLPPPPEPIAWFEASIPIKSPLSDLYGDLDAIAIATHAGEAPASYADEIEAYYRDGSASDFNVKNRFHLFCAAYGSTIDFNASTGILGPDAEAKLATMVSRTAVALFYLARGGEFLVSREEVNLPWATWVTNTIASRFATLLRAGLANGPWPTTDWPDPSSLDAYLGHELRIGDSDASRTWGGKTWTGTSPAGAAGPVATLQDNLRKLGFTGFGNTTGVFDELTAACVRDFQIEAKRTFVYGSVRYEPTSTSGTSSTPQASVIEGRTEARLRYQGPIHGVVDEATADIIASWLDPDSVEPRVYPISPRIPPTTNLGGDRVVPGTAERIRNPIVIDARAQATDPPIAAPVERWWWDAMQTSGSFFFATDKASRINSPGRPLEFAIGRNVWTADYKGPALDLQSKAPWKSAGAEAVFDRLNTPLVEARVIASVSRVESELQRDVINGWDRAVLSFGFLHWTLTFVKPNNSTLGELAALLAFYRDKYPDAFARDFVPLGLTPDPTAWGDPTWSSNGDAGKQAKYAGYLELWGARGANGTVDPTQPVIYGKGAPDPRDMYLVDFFRSWRMIYRVAMVLRTSDEFAAAQVAFARLRLRQLLARSFGATGPMIEDPGAGMSRVRTLGEIFTSELAVAFVLRIHVNAPAHALTATGAGDFLTTAVANTGGSTWATAEPAASQRQKALCDAILAVANTKLADGVTPKYKELASTLPIVQTYKYKNTTTLSTTAGSFVLGAP